MSISSLHTHPGTDPDRDWFNDLKAISHPAAVYVLKTLVEAGGVCPFECVREEFGDDPRSWIALGQLMRAQYILEGSEKLHLTERGRRGLAAFLERHPAFAHE